MQNKKSLLRRLMAIYIAYFVVLAIGFVLEFPDIRSSFMEGYEAADQNTSISNDWLTANLTGEPKQHIVSNGAEIELSYPAAELKISVPQDESIPGQLPSFLLHLVSECFKTAILILMAVIIFSLRRSIRDEQPLRQANIVRTRWIGALLLAAECLSSIACYIDNRIAASMLADSGIQVATSFSISYWNLSMGVLILFTAEVFAIGHKLGEEQKLTI